MGNANTNANNNTLNNQNATPGGVPAIDGASNDGDQPQKVTDEESRFTQVYSLGGTRFEVERQATGP